MNTSENRPSQDEMEGRKLRMLEAYDEVVTAKEQLARAMRVFDGYRLLYQSGLVLSGETVLSSERRIETCLRSEG